MSEMPELNYPTALEPSCRTHIWGRETWVASVRPERPSVIADGALAGTPLASSNTGFRLLAKVIESDDRLSVQVHPNERTCVATGGEPKSEMWCMLDDGPIFAGLRYGVGPNDVRRAVRDGSFEDLLERIDAKAGDVFMVPGGLVHSIGAGVRLYEVQQSSDTTFRLFDWNRVGTDGRPRALHVDKSLMAIDYTLTPPVAAKSADCDYFSFRQLLVDGTACIDGGADTLLFVARGSVSVGGLPAAEGASVLVPRGCRAEVSGSGALVFETMERRNAGDVTMTGHF